MHMQHCLFPVLLLYRPLTVTAVTAGVARGQKEKAREGVGRGTGQNGGGQMERLLGEVKRRCVAGTACSLKGAKKR